MSLLEVETPGSQQSAQSFRILITVDSRDHTVDCLTIIMNTRRKRTVTVAVADESDSADEAIIDEEPAHEVPLVVGSTSVEQSAAEDGEDNADAGMPVLQVATYDLLLIDCFSYVALTYGALLMQRIDNAIRDVLENGYSTHRSSRKHNVGRKRLTT